MFKKGILIGTLAVLIFGFILLLANWEGRGISEPLEIGVEDNGREVTLYEGQLLILTLESNPTTGYSWQLEEFDEAVLKLRYYKYVPYEQPSGKVGGGGEEIWCFQAQSPGETTLQLEYLRPWEKGAEPTKTFTIRVVVRPVSTLLRFWERTKGW